MKKGQTMQRFTHIHMTRGFVSLRVSIASSGSVQAVAQRRSPAGTRYRNIASPESFQNKAALAAWINTKQARGWKLRGFTGARG